MPRKYKRRLDARHYGAYTGRQMTNAIMAINNGVSYKMASESFGISVGTLYNRVNNNNAATKKPGPPTVFSALQEESMVQHIIAVAAWGFPFDTMDLRIVGKAILDKQGKQVSKFTNNFPGKEWALSFLKRHKEKLSQRMSQNIKKNRASVSSDEVKNYFTNLETSFRNEDGSSIPPDNIFNYDETNLSDDPGKKRCIFKRGVKYPECIQNSSKSATTIMFCGSATGCMIPAYVVYKAEHLWTTWLEGGPPHVRYNRSKSGWFDSICFSDWFENNFVRHVKHLPGRKVLIGDNLSSHFSEKVITLAHEHNINFVCLIPNSTHLLQPLDVAFYGPLKKYWRQLLDSWKSSCAKKAQTITKEEFPSLLKKLYSMLYSDHEEVSKNLVSGFKKCGLYPLDAYIVLKRLPDADENIETVQANVGEAVIKVLKRFRDVDVEEKVEPRKKRSRITIDPGKSISLEDFMVQSTVAVGQAVVDQAAVEQTVVDQAATQVAVGQDVAVRRKRPAKKLITVLNSKKMAAVSSRTSASAIDQPRPKDMSTSTTAIDQPGPSGTSPSTVKCIVCKDLYCDNTQEDWLACGRCGCWAHESCGVSYELYFFCDSCEYAESD